MQNHHTLRFAVTSNEVEATKALTRELGGILYADERPDPSKLPFTCLASVVSDDLQALSSAADVGLYVVCERVIKPGSAEVYGLFPLVHHPAKTHGESDAHWRDVHAPLALEHHAHMTHYLQLSVVHRISGPEIDGFALCGFASLDDLKHRFFTTQESREIIAHDIENFADTQNSPRRLIASPMTF